MQKTSIGTILVGALILSFLGAGCKTETKVDIDSDTSVTSPSTIEELVPETNEIEEEMGNEEPEVESESDTSADTSTTTNLEIKEEDKITPPPSETEVMEEVKENTSVEEPEPEPEPEKEVKAEPELKVFNMTAKQWEFLPAVITVNQGDRVQLNVTSTDVKHGISVLSFGVSANLEPGKTATLDFIADKKGTFSLVCTVFCGSGHGSMKGSLIVK